MVVSSQASEPLPIPGLISRALLGAVKFRVLRSKEGSDQDKPPSQPDVICLEASAQALARLSRLRPPSEHDLCTMKGLCHWAGWRGFA